MINVGSIITGITRGFKDMISWVSDPKNHKFVLIVIVVILSFFIFRQCGTIADLEQDKQVSQSNVAALTDSLVTTVDELGNVKSERGAFQARNRDLRQLNESLSETVDSLKNNPIIITRTRTVVERDTVFDIDSAGEFLGDNEFRITFESLDRGDWGVREIAGASRFRVIGDTTITDIQTDIVRDVIEMTITTGFRETEDGMLRIFATTNFPGVQTLDVEGALLDPRLYVSRDEVQRQRFGIGFQLGYGFTSDMRLSPYIGVGVSYNLIRW